MNLKFVVYFLIILLFAKTELSLSQSINKEICITVDDLPYITKVFKDIKTGKYITDKLMTAFKKYNVVALGSVISGRLIIDDKLDTDKVNILNQWLESGMILGNHTYSHKDYSKLYFSEFKNDVLGGELYLKDILNQKGLELKYFRHPMLFRGETKEKADSLQYFLDSLGYTVAPVTIDNSDYMFSWAYEKALSNKNDSLAKKIGADYIKHMVDELDYFENQSIKLLGYNVKHILLCHANLINADYIDELLNNYKEKGYKYITIEEALTDKCYHDLKDEFYKRNGISWLHRWAYTQGKRGDFFKGEPEVPDYIKDLIKQ